MVKCSKKVGFPHLIYFWKDKKAAHLLLLRLKKCGQNIQLLSAIIDAGAEIIAGGVEGETEAIVTELTTEASEATAAQISTITEGVTDSAGDTIGKESVTDIAAETGEGALTPLKEAAGDILANPKAVNMSILDNIINGTKSVYNSISDWYEDSVVGRAFKAIGKAYDNTIEAGYKKWIYNKFIAPLENNSLNGALKSLPHILKGPVDMLIQIEIMQGGGLIANWVSLDNQKVFNNLENQANVITDSFNSFYRSWNDAQSNEQTIYLTNFFNQINSLVQYQHVIVDTAQAQLSLISKSLLSANQNQLYYVNNPTDQSNYTFWIDQQFILSPMYNSSIPALNNPKQSYPTISAASQNLSVLLPTTLPFVGAWHNIWRVGNWEYIAEEKSFYQQTIVPLIAPAQTDKNKPSIADQALNNMVFTEYYPKSPGVVPPYTVNVDIDVTQVTYPFFVGVIFNNARWISGIQDRYQQQRYAGFYGTADKTVYLIVAESLISTQDQIKAGASAMQSPFYVITNNDISYFATAVILPNTATTAFSGKYNLSINTQPTQAAITLTSQTTATPVVTTINTTNLNSKIYNFHGIGLVSAGASASFTIQEPIGIGFPTAILSQTKG